MYFLYIQFWIRLAAVGYRGKKVRIVAFPAVRSVSKSRDTRNYVQNKPEYAICVFFTTLLYYKALGIILCDLIWGISHIYNRLDDSLCDVTGHRKMSALGTAGAVMIWSSKGQKMVLLSVKVWRASHYGVVYKLNLISNLSQISGWSVHSGSYFFHSTGTFAVSTDSSLRR